MGAESENSWDSLGRGAVLRVKVGGVQSVYAHRVLVTRIAQKEYDETSYSAGNYPNKEDDSHLSERGMWDPCVEGKKITEDKAFTVESGS